MPMSITRPAQSPLLPRGTGFPVISMDFETERMGEGNIAPKPICASFCDERGAPWMLSNGDVEFWSSIDDAIEMAARGEVMLVFHNAPFDCGVIFQHRPALRGALFEALSRGFIADTLIREKLKNLATIGSLTYRENPNGEKAFPLLYGLADLSRSYLGKERKKEKLKAGQVGEEWRTNFDLLDGMSSAEYPQDARDYVLDDASDAIEIWRLQEDAVLAHPDNYFETQAFQVCAAVALQIMAIPGIRIDPDEVARLKQRVTEELDESKLQPLILEGILRPSEPARPHKRFVKKLALEFGVPPEEVEAATFSDSDREFLTAEYGVVWTKDKPASVDTKALRSYVERICALHDEPIELTDGTPNSDPQTSTASAFMAKIAHLSPVLENWQYRQSKQKLLTTEIPRMHRKDDPTKVAERIHPSYNVLVETGRTSCSSSDLYPSGNVQNVEPDARGAYIPEEGNLFLFSDYSSLELVSFAEKCRKLFGFSVLGDLIDAGGDPHAYLGAQLALRYDAAFGESCRAANLTDPMDVYKVFVALKKGTDEEQAFYKHWRKFAKPVGLGYPGGLGAKTFVSFAFGTYGVKVTETEAAEMKVVWFETYPEARLYFDFVSSNLRLPHEDWYFYLTPFGMIRGRATYCAVANGFALQSPSAEGAKLAVWHVVRASYDPNYGSPLFGQYVPKFFIHDEIGGEMSKYGKLHEMSLELSRLMVESMQVVMTSVAVRTEPVAMLRWSKAAEPVYDSNGRLQIWTPDQKEAA